MRKSLIFKEKVFIEKPFIWKGYFEDFLLIKRIEGLRERTINDYIYHINLFFKNYPNIGSFTELSLAVKNYFSKNCAPATFNIKRAYLKSFFSYLVKEQIIPKNPIDFPKRKEEAKIYNISEEVLMKLLSLPNKNTFSGLRDHCLILLTLDTGIRPKEALNLLPTDINLSSLEITVRKEVAKTKTSRTSRTLPISPIVVLHLRKLIRARPSNWNEEAPIFCSYNGQLMLETSWGHRLKKYSKKLNFSITPYSLRHCFALYYLRSGGNVFTLQRTMRHSDLNMTKRYLALTTDDLKKQHQLASPVNLFTQKRVRNI